MKQQKKRYPKLRFKGFSGEWEQHKLGDFLTIPVKEKKIVRSVDDLLTVKLNLGGVELGSNRETLALGSTTYYKRKAGQFIYGKQNFFNGSIAIIPAQLDGKATSGDVPSLDINNINKSYLYVYVGRENYWKSKEANASGTGSKRIHEKILQEFKIMVPSCNEQRKVSDFFQQFDKLINLYQHKVEKLKKMKKSYLQKMFPKNGENVPELRFPRFTDAWEQRKLSELATIHARIGWQNLRTSEFMDSGNYMLITGTDFEDGKINYSTCHFIKKNRYEQDENIQVHNGNILITKDGTLGKVVYVQGLSMPATLNTGVFNVKIKDKNNINSKYLFQYLEAPFLMDYVSQKATGGTIKHLNQNILIDFPIIFASKDEQDKLEELLSSIDNLITLQQHKLDKLKELKKAYLQQMFI